MDVSKLKKAELLVSETAASTELATPEAVILTDILIKLRGIIYTYQLIEENSDG